MSTSPSPLTAATGSLASLAGAALALVSSGAQVLAAFHHWRPLDAEVDAGAVALDVALTSSGASPLSLGTALLVVAALPAVAAVVSPRGWPRTVSAAATALLVLWWVALGPVGTVAAGVWLAAGSVCGHLVAAALAD